MSRLHLEKLKDNFLNDVKTALDLSPEMISQAAIAFNTKTGILHTASGNAAEDFLSAHGAHITREQLVSLVSPAAHLQTHIIDEAIPHTVALVEFQEYLTSKDLKPSPQFLESFWKLVEPVEAYRRRRLAVLNGSFGHDTYASIDVRGELRMIRVNDKDIAIPRVVLKLGVNTKNDKRKDYVIECDDEDIAGIVSKLAACRDHVRELTARWADRLDIYRVATDDAPDQKAY